jgi:hypothetical protein
VAKTLHAPDTQRSAAIIKEASMLTIRTIIGRRIFIMSLALTALSVAPNCASAQASKVGVQGKWMYTTEVDAATETAREMAATAAVEDDDVWLLLTCGSDHQTTVSIMGVEAFSNLLETRISISLGIDMHPALTMSALKVNDKQISLDSGSSYALLPLLLAGNESSVNIADSRGETRRYSFTLQPNDLALRQIRAQCFDHPSR